MRRLTKTCCGPRVGPCSASAATNAGEPQRRRPRRLDRHQVRPIAVDLIQPIGQRSAPAGTAAPCGPALVSVKPTSRIAQRQLRHDPRDLRGLGGVGLQELPPRRQVVEQVGDLDRACLRARRPRRADSTCAGVDADLGAAAAPRARVRRRKCDTEAMLGSASPRKPSVAMAPRSSARRILLVACRSRHSRASSGLHADAVVLDPDQLLAAVLDGDGDARRLGVDGVLDQLLDDRGRPLDDFAGGDLVGQVVGQLADAAHAYHQPERRNHRNMAIAALSHQRR